MDGVIIATLILTNILTLVVLGGVYWRKRVWKQRAINGEPNFWSLVRESMNRSPVIEESWPSILDK